MISFIGKKLQRPTWPCVKKPLFLNMFYAWLPVIRWAVGSSSVWKNNRSPLCRIILCLKSYLFKSIQRIQHQFRFPLVLLMQSLIQLTQKAKNRNRQGVQLIWDPVPPSHCHLPRNTNPQTRKKTNHKTNIMNTNVAKSAPRNFNYCFKQNDKNLSTMYHQLVISDKHQESNLPSTSEVWMTPLVYFSDLSH